MSNYDGESIAIQPYQFGLRALIEQYGIEAIDNPLNTNYRYIDGYQAGRGYFNLYRNGLWQYNTIDYNEYGSTEFTMLVAMLNRDRLNGISIGLNQGLGGLRCVDRPPAGVWPNYTTSQPFQYIDELLIFVGSQLQIPTVDYTITPPNTFTLLNPLPPGALVEVAIISRGVQGLAFRESFAAFGAFPAAVPMANDPDKSQHENLIFINGQLQAENTDYQIGVIGGVGTLNVTRFIPGVNDIEIIGIRASNPSKWRD